MMGIRNAMAPEWEAFWRGQPDQAHAWLGPRYRTRQLAEWVGRGVIDPEQWTNVSKKLRDEARSLADQGLSFGNIAGQLTSVDGSIKFLIHSLGKQYEAVWMPFASHATLCLSSQSGCQMGCVFCATAKIKAQNLAPHEIIGQVALVRGLGLPVDRVVFMGMGEPLHNYDSVTSALQWLHDPAFGLVPRRVTLSTVGFLPKLDQFWHEQRCSLAISLNGFDNFSREEWMPVATRWSFDALLEWVTARREALVPNARRRITFEYIVAAGRDEPEQARGLARRLRGLKVRVNLIPWNAWDGGVVLPTSEERLDRFAAALSAGGVWTTIRRSRALDVQGACGQLATDNYNLINPEYSTVTV